MKSIFFLIANLVVMFTIFLFGRMMTTTPGQISGNGNPAILLLIPIIILFILLVIQWIVILKDKRMSNKSIFLLMLLVVIHITAGIYYQVTSFNKYRNYLAQVYKENNGYTDWEYINSITTGLSIHINNQYFNVNTFFMCVSLSYFIYMLYLLVRSNGRNKK